MRPKPWLVVGVGNAHRGDDAVGLEVARALQTRRPEGVTVVPSDGEPASLLELFSDFDRVVLVDAIDAGCEAGTVLSFDAAESALPTVFSGGTSTHALGLAEAIELARNLDRLPAATRVFGIQAKHFEPGAPMSPAVEQAVSETADRILEEIQGAASKTILPHSINP